MSSINVHPQTCAALEEGKGEGRRCSAPPLRRCGDSAVWGDGLVQERAATWRLTLSFSAAPQTSRLPESSSRSCEQVQLWASATETNSFDWCVQPPPPLPHPPTTTITSSSPRVTLRNLRVIPQPLLFRHAFLYLLICPPSHCCAFDAAATVLILSLRNLRKRCHCWRAQRGPWGSPVRVCCGQKKARGRFADRFSSSVSTWLSGASGSEVARKGVGGEGGVSFKLSSQPRQVPAAVPQRGALLFFSPPRTRSCVIPPLG